jgi:hypothetical protein
MYGLRGLGDVMMGPPVDPNAPVTGPDVQQQIADVWSYLWEGPGAPAPVAVSAGGPPSSLTQTLNANAGKIAIGAGAFLALILFAKAGR